MTNFKLLASAATVPERTVTNTELSEHLDTSDEWIRTRTGIRERHLTTETTSTLAIATGRQLLSQAKIRPEQVDFVIVATMSPDNLTPSVAAQVQGALGLKKAFAFDLNAACSGFVYAVSAALKFLTADKQIGMVIGAEQLSKLVDWTDRSTAVLFGDGAGGVLLQADEQGSSQLLGELLTTDGTAGDQLTAGQFGTGNLINSGIPAKPYFTMNGRAIYRFATKQVPQAIETCLTDAGIPISAVDHFLIHQANYRIITQIATRLAVPIERFPCNLQHYGNTSAASIPILLAELMAQGQLKAGQTIVMSGFGGGLTTGTLVIKL